jgi:hypothetical protein
VERGIQRDDITPEQHLPAPREFRTEQVSRGRRSAQHADRRHVSRTGSGIDCVEQHLHSEDLPSATDVSGSV